MKITNISRKAKIHKKIRKKYEETFNLTTTVPKALCFLTAVKLFSSISLKREIN